MKYLILCSLSVLLVLCAVPEATAGFIVKQKNKPNLELVASVSNASQASSVTAIGESRVSIADMFSLPRGRGSGRDAVKTFYLGFLAIIPFLALIVAPFVYIKGFKNVGRKRKGRGLAMAGIALATIGIAITLAIIFMG